AGRGEGHDDAVREGALGLDRLHFDAVCAVGDCLDREGKQRDKRYERQAGYVPMCPFAHLRIPRSHPSTTFVFKYACMKASRSPSRTPVVSDVSAPVRWSFTIL